MPWDATQPADVTKIRNLGVVIRPNWQAIQTGDATFRVQSFNLLDRTVAALPNNPVAIADTAITYCKQSAAGNSELYMIDENSNVIQMSETGKLGGPTTTINASNIQFSTATTNYTRNNVIIAYGRFSGAGATVIANNCTIARTGAGNYLITLNPVATNTNYVPIVTMESTSARRFVQFQIVNAATFRIHVEDDSGGAIDQACGFHVCGGF